MRTFVARRMFFGSMLIIVAVLVLVANAALRVAMYHVAFVSGWFLLGLCVFLALYNIRKKLTALPLGTSATWLQFHIYVGLLTFVVFVVHIDFRIPNGPFEVILALLYLAVFFSGVAGLILSRIIPPRLATRGEEVIFERIPQFIRRTRDDVEGLVLKCISESDSSAVPDFYIRRLKPFFDRPRHYWSHLCHSTRPLHSLVVDIEAQHRYLSDVERSLVDQITEYVRTKDDLDYHHAMQKTLKYWLFIHIPLTYSLLVAALFHILLVYSFAGGS
jgi:hypothetical protein